MSDKTPQTYEEYRKHRTFGLSPREREERAFAAGVASQQAEIERLTAERDWAIGQSRIHVPRLSAQLAEKETEIDQLRSERVSAKTFIALTDQMARYEAVVEAAREWEAAERAVAVESLPYLGLGPEAVFERREKATARLHAALVGLEQMKQP